MKTDLATAIIAAIAGFVIAFFVTNLLTGSIEDFSYKTVDADVSTTLEEPSPEVFNYRALNPTVEVYIGSCVEYNESGECVEVLTEEEAEPTEGPEETQEN
ncbi:hypothetical protein IKF03_00055 [Candidatus Saccharibacteria bacterium]|nr:hypothetical protein [Candidatus Saccharibacteria bacterium]